MRKFINVIYYVGLGSFGLSLVFMALSWPGRSLFILLGMLLFTIGMIATLIATVKDKKSSLINVLHHLLFVGMHVTFFCRYFYWAFWDVPGFLMMVAFIITTVLYFLKEKEAKFLTNKILTVLFILLMIPMFFHFQGAPRSFIPEGWKTPDMDDSSYRNEHYAFVVGGEYGAGVWIPIGPENTVMNGDYTKFFFNGNIRETGRLLEGELVDTVTYFSLEGLPILYNIQQDGDAVDQYFIHNGPYISHSKTGELSAEGVVKDHEDAAPWKNYYANGKLSFESYYDNDTLFTIDYFETGPMEFRSLTVNDQYEGTWHTWYSNGKVKQIGQWKNGQRNGIYKTYHTNGKPEFFAHFLDGEKHGPVTNWYITGKKKLKGSYMMGIKDGLLQTWHDNGQLESTGYYVDGKGEGELFTHYPNGEFSFKGVMENGKKSGFCMWYYDNGNKEGGGIYVNDQPHGIIVQYNEQGEKTAEISFSNGIEHGESKFFENGKLTQTDDYYMGNLLEPK